MELLEMLANGELGYFGVTAMVTMALLGLVVEIVRELVINYHKK